MKLDEGRRLVSQRFEESLRSLGFSKAGDLTFVRKSNDNLEILTFTGRVAKGAYYFTFGVGVRFPEAEEYLGVGSIEQRLFPTIGVPIHMLREVHEIREWSMREPRDLDQIHDVIMREIETLALPFLREFSSAERVREKLGSDSPQDWFMLSRTQRIAVLAALDAAGDDKARALQRVERALDELEGTAPKKRVVLERLRERLSHSA
jgi:hypothetical protein